VRQQHLIRAARIVRDGGVIAYPTEAVFGLGCDPRSQAAVAKLLRIKRRPASKGLILIASTFAQLAPYLKPLATADAEHLSTTWPGPTTWLLPVRPTAPLWLRGRHNTLAVRVTAHPLAASLCRVLRGPLVSTSANVSGAPPARSASTVRRRFGASVDYVVPGEVGNAARPTEIRDLATRRVVRAG
jgi:L-threonylcarbamoyladenylate synthase